MSMELEYQTVMIPINESYQDDVQKLVSDRWEVLPGSKPVAIYNLVRIKASAEMPMLGASGFGTLKIDESKILHMRGGTRGPDGVLRGAKRVMPDGTLVDVEEPPAEPGKVIDAGAKFG